jgi:hypothetical protein
MPPRLGAPGRNYSTVTIKPQVSLLVERSSAMEIINGEAALVGRGSLVAGGRVYSTGNSAMQDHSRIQGLAQRTETPKVTSLGLAVQKEYVILQSEPVGDFVQMELVTDGHASSPGLGPREDGLAEIMVEIAEDKQ